MAEKNYSDTEKEKKDTKEKSGEYCMLRMKFEDEDNLKCKSGKGKNDSKPRRAKLSKKARKRAARTTLTTSVVQMGDLTRDGGIKKQVMKPGKGNSFPGLGDKVLVDYAAWLLDAGNTLYETSRNKEKFEFIIGNGEVIKGWELGVTTMKKGEVSLFIIQPQYAYGATGNPPKIPPEMPLMFEVELHDWYLEDLSPTKNGKILRKLIEQGDGLITKIDGFEVKVKYTGYYKGRIFEECVKQFPLGEGICAGIPESIETALYKFRLKEKSLLSMSGKYAHQTGSEELKIPPGADVTYEVTLLGLEKVKEVFEMNTDEKLERAKLVKERGVTLFKVGHYKAALKQFKCILHCLEKEPGADPETAEVRKELLKAAYLNISLCHLKKEHYYECTKYCDKVLAMDPLNEKALFRRAQAKMHSNECSDALKDFNKLKEFYPENRATGQAMKTCIEKIKSHNLKEKNIYGNMFEKFVKQDQEKMKHMKTETGVWEDGKEHPKEECKSETQRLIERNNDLLRDANVIELSNTAL